MKKRVKKEVIMNVLHACSHSLFMTASLYNKLFDLMRVWYSDVTRCAGAGLQLFVSSSLTPHLAHI